MSEAEAYVGSMSRKAELEVAVGEEGWTVSNDESGIEKQACLMSSCASVRLS